MIKLWRKILLPLCEAVDARLFVEIGAEYGTSTNALLRHVEAVDGRLHCIDPVPAFDAEALAQAHAPHLIFHRALSLDVIEELPRHDVALVDGDHNWYTVYNELLQLEALHGEDPLAQPLILLHDIGWPYGRRDLYYDPATIPEEFRQPYERAGILPNKSELVGEGGFNPELCNATQMGGARNGVLTAVEDYMAESSLGWTLLTLPVYYGLGIMATRESIAARPRLAQALDAIRPGAAMRGVLEHAEHLRCVDAVMMQAISRRMAVAEARVAELEAGLVKEPGDGADA